MSEFYFSLPRLIASWSGRDTARSERNGFEAQLVGTLNHLLVYVSAFTWLLHGLSLWQQLLLLLPLALLVWWFWMIFFYMSASLIKLLRSAGLMRDLPDNRAQNVMVAIMTTALASYLLCAGNWAAVLGLIWIATVALNLLAAALLPASHADRPPDT